MKTHLIPSLLFATLLSPSSAQTPLPPPVPAGTAPAQNTDAATSWAAALGTTGAQAILTTYMSIAELADLYAAKAYDNTKAVQLATMYKNFTATAQGSLTALISSGKLPPDAKAAVQQMADINDLLGKMSQAIVNYINDSTDANQAAYEKRREAAWNALSKYLGIPNS